MRNLATVSAAQWKSNPALAAVAALQENGPLDLAVPGQAVDVQYLSADEHICIIADSGDILLYQMDTKEVEQVGCVDAGIKAACWSPDQELVILVSGIDMLMVMTRDFDLLAELAVNEKDFGEDKPINVGWGKKETQFRGRAGKFTGEADAASVGGADQDDDGAPRISWRGDGEFFVTSTRDPSRGGARVLRVWSRDGKLQSTSEQVAGLGQALSWRPSGNWITSSQRLPQRHDIVFFERNGLRHGEFTLPFGPTDVNVREVFWNCDSTILGVWLETNSSPAESIVQVWTVGNYHWYLKQEFRYPQELKACVWDIEVPTRLFVVQVTGDTQRFEFVRVTTGSRGCSSDDATNVAVIAGSTLYLTPFRDQVVPPPMSAEQLKLPASVRQAVYGPPDQSNDIAALLRDNSIHIYKALESTQV